MNAQQFGVALAVASAILARQGAGKMHYVGGYPEWPFIRLVPSAVQWAPGVHHLTDVPDVTTTGSIFGAGPTLERKSREWNAASKRAWEEFYRGDLGAAERDSSLIPLYVVPSGLLRSKIYEAEGRLGDARAALANVVTPNNHGGSTLWYSRMLLTHYGELCRKCAMPEEADDAYRRSATSTYFYGRKLEENDDALQGDDLRFRAIISAIMAAYHTDEVAQRDDLLRLAKELRPTSPWTYLADAWTVYFVDGWRVEGDFIQAEVHAKGKLRDQIHSMRGGWPLDDYDGRHVTLPGEKPEVPPGGFNWQEEERVSIQSAKDAIARDKKDAADKAKHGGG